MSVEEDTMIEAIENNAVSVVEYLASVKCPMSTWCTTRCSLFGNYEAMELLLQSGCPINIGAAEAACEEDDEDMLEYCLDKGCLQPDVDTSEVCIAATQNGSLACLKLACQKGCTINEGVIVRTLACYDYEIEDEIKQCVEYIVDSCDLDISECYKVVPQACEISLDYVKYFVGKGFPIDGDELDIKNQTCSIDDDILEYLKQKIDYEPCSYDSYVYGRLYLSRDERVAAKQREYQKELKKQEDDEIDKAILMLHRMLPSEMASFSCDDQITIAKEYIQEMNKQDNVEPCIYDYTCFRNESTYDFDSLIWNKR